MGKRILLFLCGILLAGCARDIQSTMITADTALITVLSQGTEGRSKVVDQALAEAARATRTQGYRYFVIVDSADASQRGVKIVQGRVVHGIPTRGYGNSNLNPGFLPVPTYTTPDRRVPYVRIGLDVTIRMYHDGEVTPDTEGVWNPDVILGGGTVSR